MLRKFKKGIAVLLAATFVLSIPTTAFADNSVKEKFINAQDATVAEVKREMGLIKPYNSDAVINKIKLTPFQIIAEMKVSVIDPEGSKYDSFFGMDYKADKAQNKYSFSSKMDFGYGGSEMNVYVDDTMVAVNIPSYSDKYYYFDKNITEEEWNEAPVVQTLDLSYEGFQYYLADVEDRLSSQENQASIPDDFFDKYSEVIKSYRGLGIYKDEGTDVVETSRGMVSTSKISCTLKSTGVEQLLNDIADVMLEDEQLYTYLRDTNSYYTDKEIDEMVVFYADSVREMSIEQDITFNSYISSTGYSIRNEVIVGNEDAQAVFIFDLLGEDYLLNEINFIFETRYNYGTEEEPDEYVDAIKYSSKGNVVPKNGVKDSDMVLEYSSQYNEAGEDVVTGYTLFVDYVWDTNLEKDNLNVNFAYGEGLSGKPETTASITGTYIVSEETGVVSVDFSNIDLNKFDVNGNVSINASVKSIDSSEITVPEEKLVNVFEITQEEIDAIIESLGFGMEPTEEVNVPMEETEAVEESTEVTEEVNSEVSPEVTEEVNSEVSPEVTEEVNVDETTEVTEKVNSEVSPEVTEDAPKAIE